ncbi:MAG: toxin-antitoxin system YwqK family antitoxin [Chlamydiales bacterium]|nr:toxin-antitoxin system YwqK family antitoxin [Chlamydiales bacterium]
MRNVLFLLSIPALLITASCNRQNCCDQVVCETYVHPYGLEMSGGEWCRQGSSGDVIVTNKDGVTVKSAYEKGVVEGEVTYTFPFRDSIETVEIYSQGKLIKETHYFPSGVVKSEIAYPSENEQVVRAFYDQGGRKSEEHFLGKQLQTATYYNFNDLVESKVDDFSGKRTQRDIYGQLVSVDTIENGVLAATTTYHPNGMPEATTPYSNGVVQGVRKTFLPGGEPYSVEEWSAGIQHGTTIIYEDGEKIAEIPYYQGKRSGVEKRFRNNDEVVEEIGWANNAKHGPTTRYVEGQVITDYFYYGTPVSKTVFDKRTALLQHQAR